MVFGYHRRKYFRPSNILWTPVNLAIAPRCWVKANSSSNFTFSSGIKVSQWNDLSGNSNHLIQPDTARQPDYLSAVSGVQFVRGSNEWMSSASYNVTINDFYFVVKIDEYSSFSAMVSANQTNANIAISNNNDAPGGHVQESNARRDSNAFSELNGGIAEIPGFIGYRLNNTTNYYLFSSNCAAARTNTQLVLANNVARTQPSSMIMKECIWLGYNASTDERRRLEGYLAWENSVTLAATHPYFSAPPYL